MKENLMFLFRDEELQLLQNDFDKPNSSFNFVFGRRKVGKTSLINEYIKDKENLYLSCVEMTPALLFTNLGRVVANAFKLKLQQPILNFQAFLEFIASCEISKKQVIVVDDFNVLHRLEKNVLLTFYTVWNKQLKNKNIQIIFLSSLKSSNKDDMNIYTKASMNLSLRSLNFNLIKQCLPNLSKNDAMYVYSAFGTNPQYLALYDEKKDFILNIKDNFLNYDSFIFHEGLNIIKNDLSEIATYSSILFSIALGNKKIGDIASFLNVKSSYLTRYLQKLVDIMVLSKNVPLDDNPLKSKFGRYEIEDNFLKFWFCYIFPNSSILQKRDFYPVISHIRRDFSKRLVQDAYKKHVLELIGQEPEKFLGYMPSHLGSWWNNKENDIDIVAYDNQSITFINCKWRQRNSASDNYEELKNNAEYFQTPLEKKYAIFAKNSTPSSLNASSQ